MKPLILLTGLPGTGKTTTAARLASELEGYALIGQNNIRRQKGIRRMPKTQDAVLRKIDQLALQAMLEGDGVIVESVNRYSFRRHQLYGIASGCGRRVLTIEAVCSEELSKKRMRERPAGDGLISDPRDTKIYDKLRASWEDISEVDFKYPGEDHVSYIQFDTTPGDQAVKRIVQGEGMDSFISNVEKILLKDF
jgi:predicted kinase